MELAPGTRLGSYEVVAPLGSGGMGEVYRARDTRLERTVALKVLRPESLGDPEGRRRFAREARAASALNHPNIVTIYDVGSDAGVDYIAMECVPGQSLQQRLGSGPMSIDEVLRCARGVAEALAAAHRAGIVHRDVKPANVIVADGGGVKVVDFGLARQVASGSPDADGATMSDLTAQGMVVGTLAYLSPEQAEGRPADARSDVFALGVTLYQMLCGERPFKGDSPASLVSAILRDTPAPARERRRDTPRDLARVLRRCLEKRPGDRYASATALASDLARCEESLKKSRTGLRAALRRPATAALVVAAMLAVAVAVALVGRRAARERWARSVAVPEVTRLTDAGFYYSAFKLAREAEREIPGDAGLQRAIQRLTLPVAIATRPPGARVFVKGYVTPDAAWDLLGETPLQTRLPYVALRWKIEKEGFETIEMAPFGEQPSIELAAGLALEPLGKRPPGMVRVPGGPFRFRDLPQIVLGDYWLDTYEVTNRQFKDFVARGGYQKPEYWPQPFLEEGRELQWKEASQRFKDTTGRPGPATWELGSFPEGRDDFPVGGLSWYEAAAYCAFAGKALPTIRHWYKAAVQRQVSDVIGVSNFGTAGPVRVGSRAALGAYGTYDMAGNVREWVWNETRGQRSILGGDWTDLGYMYEIPDARPALDRSPVNGVRCAKFAEPPAQAVLDPAPWSRVVQIGHPVDDAVFEAYRGFYSYARRDLRSVVESVDDSSPRWRKEKVSFSAAYDDDRVTAYLFMPRNARPPYQVVVYSPGGDAFFVRSSETLASPFFFDFIPQSGRVLVYPVLWGMYERSVDVPDEPHAIRDALLHWARDFGRTLDYLEARSDLDHERIALYGFSAPGGKFGPLLTALDPRYRTSVLLATGFDWDAGLPEVDVVNFLPRSHTPTLMINGREDLITPIEASAPFFRLIGVPDSQKRHAILDGGHLPPRPGIIKEVLDWLDRSLGPVAAPDSH